jgi:hypothetical protein
MPRLMSWRSPATPTVVLLAAVLISTAGCASTPDAGPAAPVTVQVTTTQTPAPRTVTATHTTTTTVTERAVETVVEQVVTTVTEQVAIQPVAAPVPPAPATRAPVTTPATTAPQAAVPAPAVSVHFGSCSEARSAGAAPLVRGGAGYRSALDRDGDGVACE